MVSKLTVENLKPFIDGDLVNVWCQIEETSVDMKIYSKNYCKNINFSIVFSESRDIKDIAHLAGFVYEVNSTFDIFEEFVRLIPIEHTTTGADILEALLRYTEDMELELPKLFMYQLHQVDQTRNKYVLLVLDLLCFSTFCFGNRSHLVVNSVPSSLRHT